MIKGIEYEVLDRNDVAGGGLEFCVPERTWHILTSKVTVTSRF